MKWKKSICLGKIPEMQVEPLSTTRLYSIHVMDRIVSIFDFNHCGWITHSN